PGGPRCWGWRWRSGRRGHSCPRVCRTWAARLGQTPSDNHGPVQTGRERVAVQHRGDETPMYEWSETDQMIRDAGRAFIDKEIRPNLDALESGEIPPYPIIRKLFAEFGIDAMARDGVEKMLARERAKASGEAPGGADGGAPADGSAAGDDDDNAARTSDTGGGGGAFDGQDSLMAVVTSELAGVCLGLVSALGVSLG